MWVQARETVPQPCDDGLLKIHWKILRTPHKRPLRQDESPEAYEALRKLTPVPFAIGEEVNADRWPSSD